MRPRLILIGGGSASGKTLLTKYIKSRLDDCISIINVDNFYKNNTDLTFEQRSKLNYDDPHAIDDDLLYQKAKEILQGHDIDIPTYDFAIHLRGKNTQHINVCPYVMIDGIFALYYPKLLELADLKIFVEADENIRLNRRISRDIIERGRTKDGVIAQFNATVAPMHNLFIEPTKENADIIFYNNENDGLDETAVNRLIDKIVEMNA